MTRAMARGEAARWTSRELGVERDAEWDALVANTAESGFMQSSAWAAFKRAEGYETPRFGVFEGEALRGGATLLVFPGDGGEGFLVCPEGPVLPWDDPERARAGLRALLATARQIAAERGGVGLRIEPRLPPPRPSVLRDWTRAAVDLAPIHTLVLDLTRPNEELLAAMHPKGRYNIRVAGRHGVRVRCSEQMADLRVFHTLFMETGRRQEFFAEPYGFFLNLGATHFPRRQAALFLAEWRGMVLAASLVIFFGRRATYLYGGSAVRHRHVMANHALHWAAVQEARLRGYLEYDMYGYEPFGLQDHLYSGFSRFKRQFGGARRDGIGAYDQVFYDRLADCLVERLKAAEGGLRTDSSAAGRGRLMRER